MKLGKCPVPHSDEQTYFVVGYETIHSEHRA